MTSRLTITRIAWVLVLVALAAIYAYFASRMYQAGTFSPSLAYIVSKAYFGLHSNSPFENLALVYPPIPILLYALFWPPVFATTVICTVATGFALFRAVHSMEDRVTAGLVVVTLLTPSVTTGVLENPIAWLFAWMLGRAMFMLVRYTERGYSVYLFQTGMLIAVGIFIYLRMAAFALIASILLFLEYAFTNFWRGVSVVLALGFPVAFFFLMWTFVQWVFTGHFGILVPPIGPRPIYQAWPVGVAYAAALIAVVISPRAPQRRYILAVCLAPLVIAAMPGLTGLAMSAGDFALVGLMCSVVPVTQIANIWLRRSCALLMALAAVALHYTLPPLATAMFNFEAVYQTIPPQVVTHHPWETYVVAARIALAVAMAIGLLLFARHALTKLTGEAT